MSLDSSSTNDDDILLRLKRAEFDNVCQEIKLYLEPLSKNGKDALNAKDFERRTVQAVRFLQAYSVRFEEVKESDMDDAVEAILECTFASKLSEKAPDAQYVCKVLRNLVAKAAKMCRMKSASQLGECLLNYIETVDQPLSSEFADLANFAANYMWYGCCGGGSTSGKVRVLNQLDPILYRACIVYLKLFVLGNKELGYLPGHLEQILTNVKLAESYSSCEILVSDVLSVLKQLASQLKVACNDNQFAVASSFMQTVTVFVLFLIQHADCDTARKVVDVLKVGVCSNGVVQCFQTIENKVFKTTVDMLYSVAKLSPNGKPAENWKFLPIVDETCKVISIYAETIRKFGKKIQPRLSLFMLNIIEHLVLTAFPPCAVVTDVPESTAQYVISFWENQLQLCDSMSGIACKDQELIDRILQTKRDSWMRRLQYTHYLIQKHINDDYVEIVLSDVRKLEEFFNSIEGKVQHENDYTIFGSILLKFSYSLYLSDRLECVVVVIGLAVKLYWKYIATESGKADIARACQKFQMSKMYELFIYSLRKLDRNTEALETIIESCVVEQKIAKWPFSSWAKLQTGLTATGESSLKFHNLTLTSCVRKQLGDTSTGSELEMLQSENAAVKLVRGINPAYHLQVLNELIEVCSNDVGVMSSAMLDKAHVLYYSGTDDIDAQFPVKLCHEVIELLKCRNDRFCSDVLARAHLSTYLLSGVDQIDKILASSTRAMTNVNKKRKKTTPSVDDDEDDDSELFDVCVQLSAEDQLLTPVHAALQIWEQCFPTQKPSRSKVVVWEDDVDWSASIDYVEILVLIYKLMESPQLSRALRLLWNMSQAANNKRSRLIAEIETIVMYNTLRQSHVAELVATTTAAWLETTDLKQMCARLYAEFLVVQAETYLLNRKIADSLKALTEASDFCQTVFKPATKNCLIVESLIWLVEAKVKIAMLADNATQHETLEPDSVTVSRLSSDTPLELAVEAVRHVIGVVQHFVGSSHKHESDCLAEKWRLLDLYEKSLFYAGVSYIQAGDIRAAKPMLLHCLVFCECFRLRKRFCKIHLTLAELCIGAGQSSDCSVHVRLVTSVMDSKLSRTDKVMPSFSASRLKSTKLSERDSPLDEDDSEDFLHSRMATVDYQTTDDVCGSPTSTRQLAVSVSPTWKHHTGCECEMCVDVAFEEIWLHCHVVEATNRLHQDEISDCKKMFLAAMKQRSRLVDNVGSRADRFALAVTDRGANKKAVSLFSASRVYQTVFDAVALSFCEVALLGNDSKNFTSVYSEAVTALCDNSLLCEWSNVRLAELFYLGATPGLVWPTVSQLFPKAKLTSVDLICAGIGRMDVSDLKTPPRGKGRVNSAMVFNDENVEVADDVPRRGRSRRGTASAVAAPVKKRPAAARGKSSKTGVIAKVESVLRERNDQTLCLVQESVEAELQKSLSILHQNPTVPLYRDVCGAVATQMYNVCHAETMWNIAYYLSECHAPTLRHACMLNNNRRIRKLDEGLLTGSDYCLVKSDSYRQRLVDMRQTLCFGSDVEQLKNIVNNLPADITICQLSVVKPIGQSTGRLFLTRFQRGTSAIVVCLPGYETDQGQKLLSEFEAVICENRTSMDITERSEWWSRRRALDSQLEDLMKRVESEIVGMWRGLLLGKLHDDDRNCRQLDHAVAKLLAKFDSLDFNEQLLRCVLDSVPVLTDQELVEALHCCIHGSDTLDKSVSSKLFKAVKVVTKSFAANPTVNRGPITLILDRNVQQLPWENIPLLAEQRVTRSQSVQFLYALWKSLADDQLSVVNTGVDPASVFYIVNPDSDLSSTQKTFEKWFTSEKGWKGIIDRKPSAEEMQSAIGNSDLFIYVGHGNGSTYIAEDTLQQVPCRSVVILMGCSSGRLVTHGNLDASGTMLHYLLAGSGCVVGNLWDVTDREIDHFLESTLRHWLSVGGSLLDAMHIARSSCKLRHLTAAAPVMYGLPVSLAASAR